MTEHSLQIIEQKIENLINQYKILETKYKKAIEENDKLDRKSVV